jgi:hypothetical protein
MNSLNSQQEKIRKFSKAVHILLSIAFVAAIAVVAFELFVRIGVAAGWPYLVKAGGAQIPMPAFIADSAILGFPIDSLDSAPIFVADAVQAAATLIVLAFTKSAFRLLRDNGTPFRDDVAKALRNLAIALAILGVATGLAGLIAAAAVGVLSMIFDYGRALQRESDTTL